MADAPRLSRWKRERTYRNIVITPRDVEIFKLLSRYRFLRKNYISAFMGGNGFAMTTRLGELYRAHYIARPDQQRQYVNANYRPMIYELDEAGKKVLASRGLADTPMAPWKHAHTEFGHLVMICDILADIELGAREAGATITPHPDPVEISSTISHKIFNKAHVVRTPLKPDAAFTLTDTSGKRTYYVLEADCGTEPIERTNLTQSSYLKKKLQYKDALERGAFKDIGFPHVWVLHVTNTDRRRENIMQLFGPSKSNLFKTHSTLGDFAPDPTPSGDMFANPWPRVGHPDFKM